MPKKKQDEVLEIDFTFESDGLVFTVAGKKFSLPKEKASLLFGHRVERGFARTDVDADFSQIQSVENAVKWTWMKRREFTNFQIADEIGVTERELIKWVNQRANVITKFLKEQPGIVERVKLELEKKYPQPESETPKDVKFDLKKARKLIVDEKLSFTEAAKKLGISEQEFKEAWQRNLSGLQKKIGG